jgi:hypothetical protein
MLKPGRSFFIRNDFPSKTEKIKKEITSFEKQESLPTKQEDIITEEITATTSSVEVESPLWPGNPPGHVAYLDSPFVLPETILNSKYLVTNTSITLPSDPLLDGREVIVYNNSIQTIIIRANLDGIFEICPRSACRMAYLSGVGLWIVV